MKIFHLLTVVLFLCISFSLPSCTDDSGDDSGNVENDDDDDDDNDCSDVKYDYEEAQRCWELSVEDCETDCLCGVIMDTKADFENRCWKEREAVACMPKELGCTTDVVVAMNDAGDCVYFGTGPDCVPPSWSFKWASWKNKFGADGETCMEMDRYGAHLCSELDDDDDSTSDDDDDTNEDGDQELESEE